MHQPTQTSLRHLSLVLEFLLLLAMPHWSYAQSFTDLLKRVQTSIDSLAKAREISDYLSRHNVPVVETNYLHIVYRGKGKIVAAPGELNRWDPSRGIMAKIEGTDLFFRTESLPPDGRAEYKIWVDSAWMLDPLNSRTARGGFGDNSDVWMAGYHPPAPMVNDPALPHGRLDTTWIESRYLQRNHPVFIYTPVNFHRGEQLPVVFVTDGEDYLNLGKMHLILDDLLSRKRIKPIIAVFVDPKTNLGDPSSNQRMKEYSASEAYLDFLEREVTPFIEQRYHDSTRPADRLLLGASMGGLISTYAVITRPGFAGNCAAQSPAYLQADSAVIKLLGHLGHVTANLYIQTGTIHDTEVEANLVQNLLKEKGATIRYEEFHEGHNWTNWRAHLARILEHFFRPN